MVASLLVPIEIQFWGPSGRIWRGGPLIEEHGDARVEVMIYVGWGSMHRDTTLVHLIWGWVGASSMEKWSTDGQGYAWWYTLLCWIALWNGSASHRIEHMYGAMGAMTQVGHSTI